MIDISTEKLISMAQAAALLPNRPSLCALWRWRTRGVRGRKLESVVIGKTPYTTVEAIERFALHLGGTDAPTIRTPRQRERAIVRAEKELADAGIEQPLDANGQHPSKEGWPKAKFDNAQD